MPARFFTWMFILLALTLGAVVWWRLQGKNEGKAAETMNATVPGPTSSILVGHWTLDGNDVVWGDTSTEIKDVSGYAKHGNFSNNLSTGSATAGRIGQGLVFNGTSDSVSLGSVYNGVKTIAFWVKPNSTTQSLIDLNGTATIDMTSGIVAANNFTTPTIYKDGAVQTASSAPTLIGTSGSNWGDTSSTETTGSLSWQTGDLIVVLGMTADNADNFLGTPTATGLTFGAVSGFPTNQNGTCKGYAWSATAGSSGSGTVSSAGSGSGNVRGIQAYVFRGSDGIGNTASTVSGTGLTISLARNYDNSFVVWAAGDWGATNDTTVAADPSSGGNQRQATWVSGQYTAFAFDWGDQGSAGTTSYGISGFSPADVFTRIALEIRGTTNTFDTTWHHAAITTATGINASAAYLGKIASSYFGGTLDDIRFYSTELSATQIADLYRSSGAKQTVNFGMEGTMTNGLVGHWTFDGNDVIWGDLSTEVKDRSGNNNHGNSSGLTASSAVIGKLGQGLSFNGTSDYVNIDGILSYTNGISQMSASVWIFQSALAEGDIVSARRDITGFWSFYTSDTWGGSDDITISLSDSDSENPSYTTENLHATNVWEHWIFVFDGTQTGNSNRLKVYKDGVERTLTFFDTIPSATLGYSGSPVANIGGAMNNASFSGKIDDVRIYNRALSATEVASLYNVGR